MDFRDIQTAMVAGVVVGDMLVPGIQLGDQLISVQALDVSTNLVDEFAVTDDGKINNAGAGHTSTLGQDVIVVWNRNYKFRHQFEVGVSKAPQRIGRTPY